MNTIKTQDIDFQNDFEHKLKMWWNKDNTIISKVLKYIHANKIVKEDILISFIIESGSMSPETFYKNLNHKNFRPFFEKNKKNTSLTKKANNFLNNIKQK
jgi:hypothetical protein